MYRELKSPLSVQLELTTRCNHQCIHCYNHFRKSTSKHITLKGSEIKKIVDNLKASEVPSLLITGGEPLLESNLLLKTLAYAKEAGLKCSLNSNVTLITPNIAEALKGFQTDVLTSILSYDKELHDRITCSTGSFDRLVAGIKMLKAHGVPVSTNMVVMQPNMEQVYETGKFAYSLGVTSFTATKVHPAQGASTQTYETLKIPADKISCIFDSLLALQKEFGLQIDSLMTYPLCLIKDLSRYTKFSQRSCAAGKTGCTIGADGQLRPCGHSDDCYGNAITESILELWPRLKKWRDGSLLPTECKECKYIMECSGGCRMDAKFNGKIDAMEPYATGNDFNLVLPPRKAPESEYVSLKTKFVVTPGVSFRAESFGEGLIINSQFKSIITPDSAKLLKNLIGKEFSLEDILSEYDLKETALLVFFTSLYKQGIITMFEKTKRIVL